jgi:glycosyltransferase involved in cell wall biosynthesis
MENNITTPQPILVVTGSLNRGGTEMHLLNVLPELDRRRFQTKMFCIAERGELADVMESSAVSVVGPWVCSSERRRSLLFRAFRLSATAFQLWLYLIIQRPKAVHFFLPESYLVGAPMAILAGLRCLIMSRRSQNRYREGRRFLGWFESALHRRMRCVLANSQACLRELVSEEGVPSARAGLIYNGIRDVPAISYEERRSVRLDLGVTGEALLLIVVANLIPYKGHEDLMSGLAQIAAELPSDWRLLVVGRDDGIGERLSAQVVRLGIADHVQFLGMRKDVSLLLGASDIGILCSHQEGFSNALLEGMAASLPMVATDVGGNAEALVHGVTGLLVPSGDPGALGEAILQLSKNPVMRKRMGEAGRQRIQECFTLERCVRNYDRLYSALLNGQEVDQLPGVRAQDHYVRN